RVAGGPAFRELHRSLVSDEQNRLALVLLYALIDHHIEPLFELLPALSGLAVLSGVPLFWRKGKVLFSLLCYSWVSGLFSFPFPALYLAEPFVDRYFKAEFFRYDLGGSARAEHGRGVDSVDLSTELLSRFFGFPHS